MKLKSSLLVFMLTFFAYHNVQAANLNSLERELGALREDFKIVQRKLYSTETNSVDDYSSNAANMQVKMGEYEDLIREALGKVDEMDNRVSSIENKIDLMNKDFQLRFNQMEGKRVVKKLVAPIVDKKANDDKVADVVKETKKLEIIDNAIDKKGIKAVAVTETILTAEQLYEKGFDLLKQGKYLSAETEFETFLQKFPEHKLAGNAQYWLGESYYVRKDYTRAVVAFAKGFEKYKNGTKGADNLLKLGMSMKAINKKPEACAAFMVMEKEFPNAPQNLKDKAIEQAKSLGCK